MSYDWQVDLRPRSRAAAALLPPPMIEQTAWDILLALHSDERCELGLEKLARLASVPEQVLNRRLASLEERKLITGVKNEVTDELRAVLTRHGRALLDRYLSATNDLQNGANH
jgi:DNA-binding MarR family transcriptional regulator